MKARFAAPVILLFSLSGYAQQYPVVVRHALIETQATPSPSAYVDLEWPGSGCCSPDTQRLSLQAKHPILSGRLYAEAYAPASVGIAFSNPNEQTVTVGFYFTDDTGTDVQPGTFTIGPHGQMARFLHEPPFNAPMGFRGTLTFNASDPVATIAVLGLVNERGAFLMPQVPVIDITDTGNGTPVIPYFHAAGVGSSTATDVVIVNVTDQRATGTFSFWGQAAPILPAGPFEPPPPPLPSLPIEMTINGQNGTEFPYDLPPRSFRRFLANGSGGAIRTGWIRINSSTANLVPAAFAINSDFSRQQTVPGRRPTTALRVPIEGEGHGFFATYATYTEVIVVNPSPAPVSVTLELSVHPGQVSRTIPAQGQIRISPEGTFNISGTVGYYDTLRITSSSPVAAIALQTFINIGGGFVREAFDEGIVSPGPLVLPHLPCGGHYVYWITFVKTDNSQASSATMRVFSETGDPVPPPFNPISLSCGF